MKKPLCFDIYCGLGGWSSGFLAEGWDCIGFDIERHVYGEHRYPAQLVIQDALTIHGSQLKDAALIVASPPCQAYSYRAMPWSRAKALPPPCNKLFDACFRIQREACAAAGHHIPLIVENVRGAQPWVGRARWNFGSFYLWGDVPALMPFATIRFHKISDPELHIGDPRAPEGSPARLRYEARKMPGGRKNRGAMKGEGIKQGGTWWHDPGSISRISGSGSPARRMGSAMIAKIPEPLSRHIARVYLP